MLQPEPQQSERSWRLGRMRGQMAGPLALDVFNYLADPVRWTGLDKRMSLRPEEFGSRFLISQDEIRPEEFWRPEFGSLTEQVQESGR